MLHFKALAENGPKGPKTKVGTYTAKQIGTIRANASKMARGAKSTIKYDGSRAEKGKSNVYKGRVRKTRGL